MFSRLKLSVVAAGLGMVAALLVSSPASASTSTYLKFTTTKAASSTVAYNPVVKQTATLYGQVGTHKKRTIKVQWRGAATSPWSRGSTVKTDKYGKFKFSITVPSKAGTVTYRALDAKAKSALKLTPEATLITTTPWSAGFGDEFNDRDIAPWMQRAQNFSPNSRRACATGSPKAVSMTGKTANLRAIPTSTKSTACKNAITAHFKAKYGKKYKTPLKKFKNAGKTVLNGHISTGDANAVDMTKPGIASARIQFAKPKGQHASFWMRPVGGAAGDAREIDIIEYMGKGGSNNGVWQFVYRADSKGKTLKVKGSKSQLKALSKHGNKSYSGYHTYSAHWDGNGKVDLFVNGKKTLSTVVAPSEKWELILSTLTSDYELPSLPWSSSKTGMMKVDWVRTWAHAAGPVAAPAAPEATATTEAPLPTS